MRTNHRYSRVQQVRQERTEWFRMLLHWWRAGLHHMNPSWFSCVMGTGILAICIMLSPINVPLIEEFAAILWTVDVALLITLLSLWGLQSIRSPIRIQASLHHFTQAQSWGAPPIACFTVASGFVIIGTQWIDSSFCVLCAQILWLCGVAGSLFSAVAIPYLMFTKHELSVEHTYGNWLLPMAPLIGAAVPGSLLAPYWPAMLHVEMLVLNYALLGTGMMLAAIVIVLFYSRLAYHKVPQGSWVPTFWMVIGPLGQSATAIIALGEVANQHIPWLGNILQPAGIAYGLFAWGFGIYWLILALLITWRAARQHLPFTLGWWSFIYPVGVMTTSTYALHEHVPTGVFMISGAVLLFLLAGLWILVSATTMKHMLHTVRRMPDSSKASA